MAYRCHDGWLDVLFGFALWPLHPALLVCKHRILAHAGFGSIDKYVESVNVSATHDQRISKRLVIAGQTKLSRVLVEVVKAVCATTRYPQGYRIQLEIW